MKKTLNVKGLHCKSCKMLIEDALEEINVTANVNVESKIIEVEYDETKISLEKIKETITSEGEYTVE